MKINDWNLDISQQFIDYIDHEYQTKQMMPAKDKIYLALELTSLKQTKVVIFGQDPYPTPEIATGLAFSSNGKLPASLRNLFKELEADLGIERANPDLSDWAKQGVLLLNTSLTVEAGNAGSHSNVGWMEITKQVIEQINNNKENVIFVLLGGHASKLEKFINDKQIILKYVHPSPLSAYRGFFGCQMFSEINQNLNRIERTPIEFGDEQTTLF